MDPAQLPSLTPYALLSDMFHLRQGLHCQELLRDFSHGSDDVLDDVFGKSVRTFWQLPINPDFEDEVEPGTKERNYEDALRHLQEKLQFVPLQEHPWRLQALYWVLGMFGCGLTSLKSHACWPCAWREVAKEDEGRHACTICQQKNEEVYATYCTPEKGSFPTVVASMNDPLLSCFADIGGQNSIVVELGLRQLYELYHKCQYVEVGIQLYGEMSKQMTAVDFFNFYVGHGSQHDYPPDTYSEYVQRGAIAPSYASAAANVFTPDLHKKERCKQWHAHEVLCCTIDGCKEWAHKACWSFNKHPHIPFVCRRHYKPSGEAFDAGFVSCEALDPGLHGGVGLAMVIDFLLGHPVLTQHKDLGKDCAQMFPKGSVVHHLEAATEQCFRKALLIPCPCSMHMDDRSGMHWPIGNTPHVECCGLHMIAQALAPFGIMARWNRINKGSMAQWLKTSSDIDWATHTTAAMLPELGDYVEVGDPGRHLAILIEACRWSQFEGVVFATSDSDERWGCIRVERNSALLRSWQVAEKRHLFDYSTAIINPMLHTDTQGWDKVPCTEYVPGREAVVQGGLTLLLERWRSCLREGLPFMRIMNPGDETCR